MARFARNFLESWLGARKWAFFGFRSILPEFVGRLPAAPPAPGQPAT